ncbi:rod shape-determining protein [Porphyromonas canoris]|uniref:Cell shape-determining protein MreB n=1 Tax=Porphyromonas canoris TaxID=36875 RepID=A0ABR4XK71_9PORP|nr:rod shape-determining protein [Porphyromonas canoris]KGN91937.1 rod shape-determining protein MreB [Porphyromonas canoris]
MGFFSFKHELAMDLGTANTVIIHDGKVVVDQPSYVTINKKTDKVEAVGDMAYSNFEKENNDLRSIRPLRDGVVADLEACQVMIRELIRKAIPGRGFLPRSLKIVICIPSGSTDVEVRAVKEAAEKAGANEVYLIHEPMAAAIGIGLNVLDPMGNMVVDIGGGTTEIAVISLGGIVSNKSIKVAGDELTNDIVNFMKTEHNMRIGERTAEQIKKSVGSALINLENPPEEFEVCGQDQVGILPKIIKVSHKDIAECWEKSILKIETAIENALDNTAPELYADIVRNGVYLAGGGALIKGLDKRFSNKFKIPFHVAEDPLHMVSMGTYEALKNTSKYRLLIK